MTTTVPYIVVLIAVHNRIEMTQRCLASLRTSGHGFRLKFVVVDDGSTDGTGAWLYAQPDDVDVLTGDGNLWFGGAIQRAIERGRANYPDADYVLILNNDVFPRAAALAAMVNEAGNDAAVGGTFWIEDRGIANSAGFLWHWWSGLRDMTTVSGQRGSTNGGAARRVDMLATTIVLVPARFLWRVRGIDTRRHPHHRADVQLLAQVRNAGARLVCLETVIADNVYGPASSRGSMRTKTIGEYLHLAFADPLSSAYVPGVLHSIWETAPSRRAVVPVLLRSLLIFMRRFIGCALNTPRLMFHRWKRTRAESQAAAPLIGRD